MLTTTEKAVNKCSHYLELFVVVCKTMKHTKHRNRTKATEYVGEDTCQVGVKPEEGVFQI